MSTVGVWCGVKNTDYDAAQALLDLHSNSTPGRNASTYAAGWRDMDSKEDIEKAAKLILSCFISSDVQANSNIIHDTDSENSSFSMRPNVLSTTQNYERDTDQAIEPRRMYPRSHEKILNKRISSNRHSPFNVNADGLKTPSKTGRKPGSRDAETQTDEQYLNPKIQLMETTIKNLSDRIKLLEAQLKSSVDEASFETVEPENNDQDFEMTLNDTYTANESKRTGTSEFDSSALSDSRSRQTNKNVVYSGILTNHNKISHELVPIGDGNVTVPSRLLKQINWNSYSSATRKLLTAVFSRRVLATHSLTGKPSPAFPNKPAKKRLDPALVNDIVQTVVERCRVPENVVRTSITTKCADESKMFRTREKNKKKRSNKSNRENISPTSDSESDDY